MTEATPETPGSSLLDSNSPLLILTHPTPNERIQTWKLTAKIWGTALKTDDDYVERETYLMTVPLAKDDGVTQWILVNSTLPPDSRPILSSCETLRKPVLVSRNGKITPGITHGIGSVFSNPIYRGKGYASRMLHDLSVALKTYQTTPSLPCDFSILYSDIGKRYYSALGWKPFPSHHLSFPSLHPSEPAPLSTTPENTPKHLTDSDIPTLCARDEKALHAQLSKPNTKTRVALIPDASTMQWHHLREDFITTKIFSRTPSIKGAISGPPGHRVWAIWTRSFYGPLVRSSGNTLHILRLVIEDEEDTAQNVERLRQVLHVARGEATQWKVDAVEAWNPSPLLKSLVRKGGLAWRGEERETGSIASLMWYSGEEEVDWVLNEKFGWY